MMRQNVKLIGASFLIAIALFIPVIAILPRDMYFKLVDAALVASAAGVAVSCIGSLIKTARSRKVINAGQALVIGIFLVALSFALVFGGLWWWRVVGKPLGLTESVFWGFNRWLALCSTTLLLTINLSRDGAVEIKGIRQSSVLVAGGIMLCLFLISLGVG